MASIYFKCDCGKSLAADVADAGGRVQCPDCGKQLDIPLPEISWKCACGEEMAASQNLTGRVVRCASCGAEHTVPVRLSLKRDRRPLDQPRESVSDVPRVPSPRINEIQCSKCGYISPPVLKRCPQCQSYLRKGALIRRQCLALAKVLLIVCLGWFLAAHFPQVRGYVQGLLGIEATQGAALSGSLSNAGNAGKAPAGVLPAGK